MATHSSVLAWRTPGAGEPGGLPSMGSHRVRHDWSDLAAAAAATDLVSPFYLPVIFSLKNCIHLLGLSCNWWQCRSSDSSEPSEYCSLGKSSGLMRIWQQDTSASSFSWAEMVEERETEEGRGQRDKGKFKILLLGHFFIICKIPDWD